MSDFNSEYPDNGNKYLERNDLALHIKQCKEIIRNGKTILHQAFLEDISNSCIESYRYKDAIFILESLIKISPYNSDYWLQRGICLSELGQNRRALKSIDKALSLNPSEVDILTEKASILMNLKYYEEAQSVLNEALSIEPDNELIYYRFGKLYQQKGLFDNAIDYFKKASEIDPTFSDAIFQVAICYEYLENNNSALEYYEKYLDLEPNCEVGWFNRGIVLEHLSQFEKAINSYELALAIDDTFTDAWFNLGNLFADLGRFEKSIECFKTVIELEKDDVSAYYNIATIYEEVGNYSNAIRFYTKAIKKDKSYHEAYLGRGYCFSLKDKMNAALQDFASALSTNYFLNQTWSLKKNSPSVDEKNILKINSLKKLIEKDKTNFELLFELAEISATTSSLDKAIEYLYKALLLDSNNAKCYYALSRFHFQKGLYKAGLYYLKKSFIIDPKLIEVFSKTFPIVYSSKLFKKFMEDNSVFYKP